MRWIAVNDFDFLAEELTLDQHPRDFTAKIIHHQITSPKLSLQDIQLWQNRTLIRVAQEWASNRRTLNWHMPEHDTAEPFANFRKAVEEYVVEQRNAITQTIQDIITFPKSDQFLEEANRSLSVLQSLITPDIQDSILSINKLISAIPDAHSVVSDQIIRAQQNWTNLYRDLQFMNNSSPYILELAKISEEAQNALRNMNLVNIPKDLYRVPDLGINLQTISLDFSQAYKDFLESTSDILSSTTSLLSEIKLFPSIEYFNNSSLYESVFLEDNEIPCEQEKIEIDISISSERSLTTMLGNLDSNFVNLWIGARQAIESDNPDKIRHAFISMRELVTHILHRLSPDAAFFEWCTDDSLIDERKRPTRRGRLLYIFRDFNEGTLNKFILADIECFLEIMNVLQRVHQLNVSFNERQVRIIKSRIDGFLRFLLELSEL